jgi:hypothetical protein
MSMALEELTKEVIQLPSHQRLALASFLLELDTSSDGFSIDSDWDDEIQSRIKAIDDGTAVGISYSEVMRSAESRLR